AVSETSPKIFPLTLGSSEPAGYVVIACLVRDFFPSEPLTVTWSPSREGVIVRNFPPAQAGGPVHHEQPADLASRAVPSRSDPEVPSAAPLQIQPVRERALQRLEPRPRPVGALPGQGGATRMSPWGVEGWSWRPGEGRQWGSLTCSDFSLSFTFRSMSPVLQAQPVPAATSPCRPAPGLQCQPHVHTQWPEKIRGCQLHLAALRWEGCRPGVPHA
uniref:Ig-like domain-containing protein n=1 Tax=Sus scrofa TaxID=9823 RepID=A0A8D0TZX6_PIG